MNSLKSTLTLFSLIPASLWGVEIEMGASWATDFFANRSGSKDTTAFASVLSLESSTTTGSLTLEANLHGIWADLPSSLAGAGYSGISGFEAEDGVRFARLALSGSHDALTWHAGYLLYDDFFTATDLHGHLINPFFGPFATISENHSAAVWPLSTLGLITDFHLGESHTLMLGVFDGNAGDESHESLFPEVSLNQRQGALLAGEYTRIFDQFTLGLGGTWHTGEEFTDFNNGRTVKGLGTVYILGQYDDADGKWSLAGRFSESLSENRSVVSRQADLVLAFHNLLTKESDTFALGYLLTDFSPAYRDAILNAGDYIASTEQVIEVNWQVRLPSNWTVQPGTQYSTNAVNAGSSSLTGYIRTTVDF